MTKKTVLEKGATFIYEPLLASCFCHNLKGSRFVCANGKITLGGAFERRLGRTDRGEIHESNLKI